MDKGTFSSVQLFYFTLCFLHSILLVTGTLSIEPQFACVGDRITINCSLSVPGPTDLFSGLDATYIIGNDDDPILPTTVNGASMSGGVDLSKLMAVSVFGNSTFLEGRLVLLSYLPEDNNIRLGCENEYRINGDTNNRDYVNDTLFLKQADAVYVSESTLNVKSNISLDSVIYSGVHDDISSVERADTLSYNLTLHYNGTTETLSSVPSSQINSTSFTSKFHIDTYYRISVSAINCNGGTGSVYSKTFVLLALRGDNGKINSLPQPNKYEFEAVSTNLIEPEGGFEQNYLSKDSFLFTVVNSDTSETILNLTDSDFELFLPQRFEFSLPDSIETLSGNNILRIFYNGELIANIPLTVQEIPSNTLMIILIVLFVLLALLLIIIIAIIVSFVVIHFKRKRDSDK